MKKTVMKPVLLLVASVGIAMGCLACSVQRSPEMVADQFILALVDNRQSALMEMTVPEARAKLDALVRSRQRFKCTAPFWDFEKEKVEIWSVDPMEARDATSVTIDVFYQCWGRTDVFTMRVNNINLVRMPNDSTEIWLVKDWGDICEAHDFTTCVY
jgi:hypothetical protein